ncbi:MAG: radical SAM protein [bacterium]
MQSEGYDPLKLAEQLRPLVVRGTNRKYYRLGRKGMWYGGIATADCLGCSLRCVFCWSNKPRDNPERMGEFYEPGEVYDRLLCCARREGYSLMRVSGNEPALAREHLLGLLAAVDSSRYRFILETNGIHLNQGFARSLSEFGCLHVRVSLKGASEEEFHVLTGARKEAFQLQLGALQNLVSSGVSCHAAVMSSFSSQKNLSQLRRVLHKIDRALASSLEEEELLLYPHVERRLREAGIYPLRGMEE